MQSTSYRKAKQISDECHNSGGTGNATVNDESDRKENEEKSDIQECDEKQQSCFDIIQEIIKKVKKIIRIFCKSPVENENNLQTQDQQSFKNEKSLFLDCKTCWNCLLNMLQRFYKMRKEVKDPMLWLDKDFNISFEEFHKIKEICDFLAPLEMAV